jgi:alpha-L-arabinofuranosidase
MVFRRRAGPPGHIRLTSIAGMPLPGIARFVIDPAFTVGAVDPRLFGSSVEHGGRCVYSGVYEPGHPTADAVGLRGDVLALIHELGVTAVRYPGGDFVSGHRWEDSVGAAELRPQRLNKPWESVETHRFGLSEFMTFARTADVEPMMAFNLAGRDTDEACDLLEYSNHPSGTLLSDLRVAHGDPDPYGVRLWGLGDAMDRHRRAAEYGRLAARTARELRGIDQDVELVLSGGSPASPADNPGFPSWETEVLAECHDLVDHVSARVSCEELDGDRDSFLASAVAMERRIETTAATCDVVRAAVRGGRRLGIVLDEWIIRDRSRTDHDAIRAWPRAPRRMEDGYTVTDAVVVGSLLITLLRRCDRVTAACFARLVNTTAPIMTQPGGPAWRQTIFYPFAQAARWGRGHTLRVEPESPAHTTAQYGRVPLLHATAVMDDTTGAVTVFAVNRHRTGALPMEVVLRELSARTVLNHTAIADADPQARNTLREPERVTPVPVKGTAVEDGTLRAELPPMSWNVIRLAKR